MITAEEARNNDQLYFSNSYKTALSLYLKPEDNYSELIDLIDRSVRKQSHSNLSVTLAIRYIMCGRERKTTNILLK